MKVENGFKFETNIAIEFKIENYDEKSIFLINFFENKKLKKIFYLKIYD